MYYIYYIHVIVYQLAGLRLPPKQLANVQPKSQGLMIQTYKSPPPLARLWASPKSAFHHLSTAAWELIIYSSHPGLKTFKVVVTACKCSESTETARLSAFG